MPALLSAVPAWRHGMPGSVPPQELWAAAERQGRTVDLTRWLLHSACAEATALDELPPVAVALAPGHWSPEGLADDVRAALAGARLPAARLVLALPEEALVASTAALLPELHAVEQSGVRLTIDGYGMGHTLFALLARAPSAPSGSTWPPWWRRVHPARPSRRTGCCPRECAAATSSGRWPAG